jgi:tRNA A37 threonylcarbamoyladenosine dehydratase
MSSNPAFHRLSLLTGKDSLDLLSDTKVIIFGIGGVGSWCAEALIRSGIGHLTIVDSDVVCITNINRQIQATHKSIGKSKTAELSIRLAEINPDAEIIPVHSIFSADTVSSFNLESFDYVIDAIDSLSNKVELIMQATNAGCKVFSALGASNKMDVTKIKVGSLWDSRGCRLGRFVRKRLRKRGFNEEVTCVYSDEFREPFPDDTVCGTETCFCPQMVCNEDEITDDDTIEEAAHEWCSSKKQINGSAVHITGTYGFILSGLVIQDVTKKVCNDRNGEKSVKCEV